VKITPAGRARPQIEAELRALVRQMSLENLLWGAPRIHGELPKLGFAVAQSSVSKYMVYGAIPQCLHWATAVLVVGLDPWHPR
jgi:hypothetical protein